jgi:hypothetical protein
MDIAVAGVGSLIAVDPKSRACIHVRIALAAVALLVLAPLALYFALSDD